MDERLVRRGDYIAGSFVRPERVDGYVVWENPGDRADSRARFPFSEASIDEAAEAARQGVAIWREVPIATRALSVRRFRETLVSLHESVASLLTRETGKPLWESRQEVNAAIRAIDLLLEDGLKLLESRVLDAMDARSDFLPRGVVGLFTPYTFPILLPALQTSAAILAGNAVIHKPSKFTPACGQWIAETWDRCRLVRGAYNLVQGSGRTIGKKLAIHPVSDALLFSGTHANAAAIAEATAHRPEPPKQFQCGGKGVALVLADAEMHRATYEILIGAFLTTGQRSNSTARVFVHVSVVKPFMEQLIRATSRVMIGYGFDDEAFMGPLISEDIRTKYRKFGKELEAAGHRACLGVAKRDVVGKRGYYATPAIYEMKMDAPALFLEQEPPGPILLVYPVSSWEEMLTLHQRLAYRGATAIFTEEDEAMAQERFSQLQTGALTLNRGTIGTSLRLLSVGLGKASNGFSSGMDVLHFLSTPRAWLVNRSPFDPKHVVPGTHWVTPDNVELGLTEDEEGTLGM